ncbi:MAG: cytochrome c oxidase subunit 3 [Bacteroidetes bacterium]|nr:cytochrome c oxidase subunit 3 [Bacteroidota bacterium]
MSEDQNNKSLYYPPGGILLWIIITLELLTFGMALVAFIYFSKDEPQLFHSSRLLLNTNLGITNTIVLLTSGFFMAIAANHFKTKDYTKVKLYLNLVLLSGLLFCGIKGFEFYHKFSAGLTLDSNVFFTFYWLLTGFHYIHVLVGLVIIGFLLRGINKNATLSHEDFEGGAAFWHMCDLIWLIVFPVIYLLA